MGHTPGPWEVVALSHNGYPYSIKAPNGNDRKAGAVGSSVLRWGAFMLPSSAEALANARLIAAAPELLSVAEQVVKAAEIAGLDGPLSRAANLAIAKVRGETA